jgi:hypothetical protein
MMPKNEKSFFPESSSLTVDFLFSARNSSLDLNGRPLIGGLIFFDRHFANFAQHLA